MLQRWALLIVNPWCTLVPMESCAVTSVWADCFAVAAPKIHPQREIPGDIKCGSDCFTGCMEQTPYIKYAEM